MITSFSRGHEIYWDDKSDTWRFTDNNSVATEYDKDGNNIKNERPCIRCGKMPTVEGYDACLGHIDGATSACCGHGVEEPYELQEEAGE